MEQRAETSRSIAKGTTDDHGRDPYLFIVGCGEVRRLLEAQLADTLNAWELKPDGSFAWLHPKESEEPLDSQAILLEEGF
jgi:hypothetical protein